MLHKFFEEGDWFAPKRLGYGAGLPIAWQGWVLTIAYIGLVLGIGLLVPDLGFAGTVIALGGMLLATIGFLMIAKARTKGGWKWRK
jgi:hypothetical protein